MRNILLLLTATLSLTSGGCIVPYAYPKLDYTFEQHVGAPPHEVRAFRVDHSERIADLSRVSAQQITEIPVSESGMIQAQSRTDLVMGAEVIGALNYSLYQGKGASVKLYRRGYHVVEILPWQWSGEISWEPANDLESQAAALAELFPPKDANTSPFSNAVYLLRATNANQRSAYLFGAAEHRRLAQRCGAEQSDLAKLLLQRAAELEKLAVEEVTADELTSDDSSDES